MNRPERKSFTPAYHWRDIESFIEAKHGIKLRGYKPEPGKPWKDFWHYLLGKCHIQRGCFFRLPEDFAGDQWWQQEIMHLILDEFPELKTEAIWVDW